MTWLSGIEPAWTLLDFRSHRALLKPSCLEGPIALATDLTEEETRQSAVARNAEILLRAASERDGLKLTATGNLSRSVVAEMCDLFIWPGFDKAKAFQLNRVVNEPDFLPLFFLRHVATTSKLLRRYKGHLRITRKGQQMLDGPERAGLQAALFTAAFRQLDLRYLGRALHQGWPQRDVGLALWSLSVAAHDWQSRERLARLCTVPIESVLNARWDTGSLAMEAVVLRPLEWFGLLERREEAASGSARQNTQLYRKTPLFDRFLSFDVTLEADPGHRH